MSRIKLNRDIFAWRSDLKSKTLTRYYLYLPLHLFISMHPIDIASRYKIFLARPALFNPNQRALYALGNKFFIRTCG